VSGPERARRAVVIVAAAISALAVILFLGALRNDLTIRSDTGTAVAEVLSAGSLRSAVSFVTPDGVTHNPELGVLYPTGLTAGQRIAVEYARSDPDLVRVTGRDARVALIPTGSVIVVTWLIATPVLIWLRRRTAAPVALPDVKDRQLQM
jgi:cytochrome c-type biogenesis protein CcmE